MGTTEEDPIKLMLFQVQSPDVAVPKNGPN